MKKIVSFLLTITLLLCNGIAVLAEEIPTPPADQISSNPNYAFAEKYFLINPAGNASPNAGEDGLGLVYVHASISPNSSSSVLVTATTTANIICMDIGGFVCIERWINNDWSTYYLYPFWSHGVASFSTSEIITVESGYYYRIHTTHIAISMHSTASATIRTTSVLIN